MLVLTDAGALALIVAIISGGAAFVVNATWPVPHSCGDPDCRRVGGGDKGCDPRRP